jgi:hypothetical protein
MKPAAKGAGIVSAVGPILPARITICAGERSQRYQRLSLELIDNYLHLSQIVLRQLWKHPFPLPQLLEAKIADKIL